MQQIKNIRWTPVLMGVTILGIAAFQLYWLIKTYDREKRTLEARTNMSFRETVRRLQASKLKLDSVTVKGGSVTPDSSSLQPRYVSEQRLRKPLPVRKKINTKTRRNDSLPGRVIFTTTARYSPKDSLSFFRRKVIMDSADVSILKQVRRDQDSLHMSLLIDSTKIQNIEIIKAEAKRPGTVHVRAIPGEQVVGIMTALREKERDKILVDVPEKNLKTKRRQPSNYHTEKFVATKRPNPRLVQMLYDFENIQDSVKVHEIKTAFAKRLTQQKIDIPFEVVRFQKNKDEDPQPNEVTVGFQQPLTYQLSLGSVNGYLLQRIASPIALSLFIVGFTAFSFSILYRNLLRQRRLADIKNEFISNITHELKTPIATVSVAIEALRSFNANIDPVRTKEYLDISANELQRLSLLVDKVLKLSMFEKKEIDLKYEPLDMKDIVDEVTSSMRLQIEKRKATVNVVSEGDTSLEGDRLHLVSVLFNLLDNALKYSTATPQIEIRSEEKDGFVTLSISDNGIGIPSEYQDKVFEKFFRVPTGNLHNAKGYGLGLSYVANIIEKHGGTIKLESEENFGSKFVIQIPKHKA